MTSRPGPSEAVSLMVQLGAALAKRLVDKIEADEYIDFDDLPPFFLIGIVTDLVSIC